MMTYDDVQLIRMARPLSLATAGVVVAAADQESQFGRESRQQRDKQKTNKQTSPSVSE